MEIIKSIMWRSPKKHNKNTGGGSLIAFPLQGNDVDLHESAAAKVGSDGRADWWVFREECGIDLVHSSEIFDVFQQHDRLHHSVQGRPGSLQCVANVYEGLIDMRLDCVAWVLQPIHIRKITKGSGKKNKAIGNDSLCRHRQM